MKFRTEIEIKPSHFRIGYEDPVALIGSCFTENIGNRLRKLQFLTDINPFGVVYNPLSVKRSLSLLMKEKEYNTEDLEFHNGNFFSWDHHSDFSANNKDIVIQRINDKLKHSSEFLGKASYLFISMGTAWVYKLKSSDRIVCNCHKVNEKEFQRELLTPEKIAGEYGTVLNELRKFNPDLRFIFTISPVRHWKDGAHGNQISKSVLHLAVRRILDAYGESCDYFPSYELLIDDLRDYRYYNEDLLHPNQQAIDYIWEKFSDRYFDEKTISYILRIQKLVKASEHRVTDMDARATIEFRKKQKNKIDKLRKELPFLKWGELAKAFD